MDPGQAYRDFVAAKKKMDMSACDFAEMMEVEYTVEEYFEPEEWAKMKDIERRRYANLRANYEVMKAMREYYFLFPTNQNHAPLRRAPGVPLAVAA